MDAGDELLGLGDNNKRYGIRLSDNLSTGMGDVVYAAFELVCNFSLPLSESTAEHLPGLIADMVGEHSSRVPVGKVGRTSGSHCNILSIAFGTPSPVSGDIQDGTDNFGACTWSTAISHSWMAFRGGLRSVPGCGIFVADLQSRHFVKTLHYVLRYLVF
jgi:hypothetical protein